MENVTKSVHVFFGGATNLEAERDLVNSVANELSSKYDNDGIHVVVSSFKTLGDNQEVYINFLKDVADVAIFAIRGEFNQYTRSELNTALEEYRKESRPSLHVFQNLDISDPKQAAVGEELTTLLRPQHAVRYNDIEELRSLVRDRITDAIKKQMQKNQIQSSKGRSLLGWAVASVMFVLSIALFLSNGKKDAELREANDTIQEAIEKDKQQKLLFVGGGSVCNYIKNAWNLALDTIPNSHTIPLPSGTSCKIIGEEGNRVGPAKYVPILLSAERVTNENAFTGVCNKGNLIKRLVIYEYWLGRDYLKVFADSSWVWQLKEKNRLSYHTDAEGEKYLTADDLTNLINCGLESNSATVYITSVTSGTLAAYEVVLGQKKIAQLNVMRENSGKVKDFHPNNSTDAGARIILGSENFPPKKDDNSNVLVEFHVAKPSGNESYHGVFMYKQMFLYIPAYKEGEKYRIPDRVIDFLKMNPNDTTQYWKKISEPKGLAQDYIIIKAANYEK